MVLNADAFSREAIKTVNEESEVVFEALTLINLEC